MKTKLLLICSFFIIFFVKAQDLIAVQNGGTPRFYEDISEALENAIVGDTLYIPGRNYIVNDTIRKPLHLVGTGTNPNYSNASGLTTFSSSSIVIPQLVLEEGANGGSITGIHFTTNYYNGNPRNSMFANVTNYQISRCYFGSNVSGIFSNSLIRENIFRHRNSFNSANGSSLITNNIFLDRSNGFTNCLVTNNIFLIGGQYYEAINASNCRIENNILPPNYAFDNLSNCSIKNNVNGRFNGISGTNIYSGNFDEDIGLDTIFVNYSQIPDVLNYSVDFHLPNDSSYKNAGTDGNDIGIYGGRYPWKDGSIPFNPHIISKNISGTTDQNGNLPIEIEVQSQQN